MKTFNKSIALILILSFALMFNPLKSNASWSHGSTDLPGTVDDGTIIALGAVAAVGVGVLVYVLIKKSKQKKAMSNNFNSNRPAMSWENQFNNPNNVLQSAQQTKSSVFVAPKTTTIQQMENAKTTIPVDLVVKPLSSNNFAFNQTNGVQVGVRIRF